MTSSVERATGALGLIAIALLLLPTRDETLGHTVLVSSLALVAFWPSARASLIEITLKNKALTCISICMSILILAGGLARGNINEEIYSFLAPVAWIPVASICLAQEKENTRIEFSSEIAPTVISILTTATVLIHQLFMGQERPPGLSYNVLTGPLLMLYGCLAISGLAYTYNKKSNHRFYKTSTIIIFLLCITGAAITASRLALVVFMITAAVVICTTQDRNKRRKLTIASIATSCIWLMILAKKITKFGDDLNQYKSGHSSSSTGDRIDALKWSMEHFFDHPLIGYGPTQLTNAFNNRWAEWQQAESSITKILHLHNDYIQIALSYGTPCLALQVLFWITLCRYSTNRRNKIEPATLAIITIIATTSTADSFSYWSNIWATCYAMAGLIIYKNIKLDRNTQTGNR